MKGWKFTHWENQLAARTDLDPWAQLDHLPQAQELNADSAAEPTDGDFQNQQTRRDQALHHWRIYEIAKKTGKSVEAIRRQMGLEI